jgi:serine/threonine-protein kinase
MTPDQQRRVRDVFEAAIDRDPAEARTWIAACVEDPTVRDEALSLLDHHSRAGRFLNDGIDVLSDLLAAEADDPGPIDEGTMIGGYRVIRELGRGGMGRVYLASDSRLGRLVALKAVAPEFSRDPQHRERLRREARAAAGLTHPGICTVYALEEVDDALFIASEYVDGRTLRDEITAGVRPTADEILGTARELAEALAAAHVRKIVHRDLKPENVMRTAEGRLKILDFGLARVDEAAPDAAVSRITNPGIIVGTPGYMAPEQLTGGRVDARTDVFSFGVVIYEYASGLHPFSGPTPAAALARVFDGEIVPLSARTTQAGNRLSRIVGRCLHKSPDDRYASASAIVDALAGHDEPSASAGSTWWRTHQLALIALYIAAGALAWRIKAWTETPLSVAMLLSLGAVGTIGGLMRGHLLFTERVHAWRLSTELRRMRSVLVAGDVTIAVLMIVAGLFEASIRALVGLSAVGLGIVIAAATLLFEPVTTSAAFGDRRA